MIRRGEVWAATDPGDTPGLLGCIQVLLKPPSGDDHQEAAPPEPAAGDTGEEAVADVRNAGPPATHSGPLAEFTCLAVAESAIGLGLGEALVRAAESHARQSGCDRMLLGVMCPNVAPDSEPSYKQWLQVGSTRVVLG